MSRYTEINERVVGAQQKQRRGRREPGAREVRLLQDLTALIDECRELAEARGEPYACPCGRLEAYFDPDDT